MAVRTSMALPGCQMHQIYKVHLLPAVTVDAALTEDTATQLNDQPEPYQAPSCSFALSIPLAPSFSLVVLGSRFAAGYPAGA